MAKLNWERASRRERMTFVPSPRSEPATQAQLNYITNLSNQKGEAPPRRMPLTKEGASSVIDRLKAMPDVNAYQRGRMLSIPTAPSDTQIALAELRERFNLSPQTVQSLYHILSQIDEATCAFFFDAMLREELPDDQDELLVFILRQFVNEYA